MPKSTRIPFTCTRVAKTLKQDGDKATFHWDADCSGLGLRITNGARTFIFQKKLSGDVIRMTLGPVPTDSTDAVEQALSRARLEAHELASIISEGKDPRIVKAQVKKTREAAEERAGMTVAEVWCRYVGSHPRKEDYIESDRKPPKNAWSDRHRDDHKYAGEHVLKPLMNIRIAEVDAATIKKWIDSSLNNGRDTAVRQSFLKIRAFWRWASGKPEEFGELTDPSMFSHKDLTDPVPSAGVKDDVLQTSQLKDWFTAVRAIPNQTISAYLQCLLLCGARRNELGALKWTDIDRNLRTLKLHDKIEIGGRTITVTNYMWYLMDQLPRINEWVFATNRTMDEKSTGRIVEPRIAHKKALASVGLPLDLSLHGLRRTFATVAADYEDLPAGIAAQLMGHRPSATAEKHYIKRSIDTLRKWHQRLEDFILQNAEVSFDAQAATAGLHVVENREAVS